MSCHHKPPQRQSIVMHNELIKQAQRIMQSAYAPYSNFKVGAAILSESGTIYSGCNVENAAYPVGSCAEAGAISAMIAGGDKKIIAIAVAGKGTEPCTPCGGCRQRIREFSTDDTTVLICDDKELRLQTTLGKLLPMSFGPDNLQ